MRKIEKISKKHKILKELSEQSDLFRKIKVLLIFVVIAAAVYLEHNALGWLDYFDNYSLPDIFTVYGFLLSARMSGKCVRSGIIATFL